MKKKIILWLIKKFLPGYSLHRNPPKGRKKKREMKNPQGKEELITIQDSSKYPVKRFVSGRGETDT
jgi:hypothetical protein